MTELQRSESRRVQFTLRSLLILTAMTAVTLSWWRMVGYRYLPGSPRYWGWGGWLTILMIGFPFFVPFSGQRFQAHAHAGIKLWVALSGANVIFGFVEFLWGLSAHGSVVELIREGFTVLFWSAFAVPVSLAFLASASVGRPQCPPNLWAYGLIVLVVCDVLLLYRLIPVVFAMAEAK